MPTTGSVQTLSSSRPTAPRQPIARQTTPAIGKDAGQQSTHSGEYQRSFFFYHCAAVAGSLASALPSDLGRICTLTPHPAAFPPSLLFSRHASYRYRQWSHIIPDRCPKGQFCPDEEDACQALLPVGSVCQLNRDGAYLVFRRFAPAVSPHPLLAPPLFFCDN